MEILTSTTKINFMGMRYFWISVSLLAIVGSFVLWFSTGDEKFSVDFVGGSDVVVGFKEPIEIAKIRQALDNGGITSAIVQSFENNDREFSIRVKAETSGETGKRIREALSKIDGSSFEVLKEDFVGPIIGEEIRNNGIRAICFGLLGILIYVGFRFEFRFALGAISALLHDVIVTVGIVVLTGGEIGGGTLAALLTIVGFSVNDTIIIFDRIRENLILREKGKLRSLSISDLMNLSVNQTLSRTIITNLTAFVSCATLWIFGGGALQELAFALTIGVVVGTYSTIFIASPIVLALEKKGPEGK